MTRERWIDIGSIAAALGGLSWLAKVAVIIATDGRVTDEGAAALFYILGVALMTIGSTAVGALLAGHRSRLVLAVAVPFRQSSSSSHTPSWTASPNRWRVTVGRRIG